MRFDPEKFETFLSLLPENFEAAARIARKSELPKGRKFTKVTENFRMKHALEVRHASFLNPWFVELLRKYNVALVFADTAGKWPYMEDITSDFIYVRLHGDEELYVSGYDSHDLEFWSSRIKRWKNGLEAPDKLTITDERPKKIPRDIFVYFDNDAKVRAPVDAKELIKKLRLS